MAARSGRGDPGFYPERREPRDGALDRLVANIGFRAHMAFARELRAPAELAAAVAGYAARFRASAPASQVADLRYQLRRDGLSGDRLAQCFGLYAAASGGVPAVPAAEALAAAAALVSGGVLELADAAERGQALALAAAAFALCGVPVHLYAASDAQAREVAGLLAAPLAALGLGAAGVSAASSTAERRVAYGAPVVCGTQRVIAFDYLRDRMQLGRRRRPLQSRIERLSGDTTAGLLPMLNGLHCALVADADEVLVDDARRPMVISANVEAAGERLPFEQALELAGALAPEADFAREGRGVRLSERGAHRLARFGEALGGLWAARKGREELVCAALTALYVLERGRDYEVERGMLRLPARVEGEAPEPGETLQRLLEVKEALPLAGHRDVLAQLSVPRFFRRYLRLAGACADARGLESEIWSLYALRTSRVGALPTDPAPVARVFASAEQRRGALAAAVRERAARGEAVVVALRSAGEAGAVAAALQQAGLSFHALRAGPEGSDPEALAALAQPGAVVLSFYPAQRGVRRAPGGPPLHVAVADLHDAARHVVQIAQCFAASSCEQYLALEDDTVARGSGAARSAAVQGGAELPPPQAARIAAAAQRAAERACARARAEQLARERSLEELLAFSGLPE